MTKTQIEKIKLLDMRYISQEKDLNYYMTKARIIYVNFSDGLSLEEVGEILEEDVEVIQEIEQVALRKIKHPRVAKLFMEYLSA